MSIAGAGLRVVCTVSERRLKQNGSERQKERDVTAISKTIKGSKLSKHRRGLRDMGADNECGCGVWYFASEERMID